MKTPVILLVDDEDSIINSMRGSLEDEGYIVRTASDGIRAMDIVTSQPVDVVFLDIWMPGMDGLETLKAVHDFDSSISVVMMTGHGTVNTAVQAVKLGAFDFLEKPFSLDTVIDIIKKIKESNQALRDDVQDGDGKNAAPASIALLGESPDIIHINALVPKLAATPEGVLLQGEVGTGKEIVARLLHGASDKKSQPFIKFNCALYPHDELESELFGRHKGKDQTSGKTGVFGDHSDGVLFLKSIESLPVKAQKRLGQCMASGHSLKIIASTAAKNDNSLLHKDLGVCFPHALSMPPLRNRRSDIPHLLNHFMAQFCSEYGIREKTFEDDTLEILVNYDWPGNVKELKNMVEKLVVSVPTRTIFAHDIPLSVRDELQTSMTRYYERYKKMDEAEAAWRKNFLLYHLRKNNRDIHKTAKVLHLSERSLKKYIKDYGIVLSREKKAAKKFQRTLKRSMVMSGTGLHSGDKTGLILTPLSPNSGIVFGSISSGVTIPAHIDYVVSTAYATCLEYGQAVARTIEHFLAVLHAYKITNLMIKINNEVPIMDGSSSDFCRLIEDAGIEEQEAPLDEIIIKQRYTVGDVNPASKFITIEPADVLSIHYTLHYPKPVGHQELSFVMDDEETFRKEIAPARTFGFVKDIEALEQKGLGSGGRLTNFILIDDEKIVNTDLRFADEFVRHKILDMIGDLYLLGRPVRGKITANRTGHSENVDLVRLVSDKMHL